MKPLFAAFGLVLFLLAQPAVSAAQTRLVMFEQQGCVWCAKWRAEVGIIYAKTDEGKQAPLLRLDINDPIPATLHFKRKAFFTPTFVLMVDGVENGRIEGYPGEDFFRGLLDRLLKEATATSKVKS